MKHIVAETKLLPLTDVKIQDSFWSSYINLVRDVVVPYQWDALKTSGLQMLKNRVMPLKSSKSRRDLSRANFTGWCSRNSHVAKWLEARQGFDC